MLAILLIFFPAFIAIINLLFRGNAAKWFAFGGSLLQLMFLAAAVIIGQQDASLLNAFLPWIPSLGISFHVGFDGIGLVLVALTNILVPVIILSSFNNRPYSDNTSFYSLILLMQSALVGVFLALDCFLFYVFWEAALIPIYFIAAIWGGENKIRVTFKFFIYTIFGSLFMLIGILYLYILTPAPHSFDIAALTAIPLDQTQEIWVFLAFFIAFAIKMPIFPFHSWQPDTYTVAPTPATMLLSGIMLKMGIFGIIRWIIPVTPFAFTNFAFYIIILAVIGIVYASVIAIQQKDFKRLVAFSSIAHVGLIAAGLFTGTLSGVQGAVIQMFNHGINVVGIFFILEIISQRTSTREIASLGGIIHSAPKLAICFIIILLGNVALPLTNGFAGEFLLLFAIYQISPVLAGFAGLTIILGAVYMLRMYKTVMLGEANETTSNIQDLTATEMFVLFPICLLVIVIGIFPNLILSISEPVAADIVNYISGSTSQVLNLKP